MPLERHYAGVLRKLSLWLGLALGLLLTLQACTGLSDNSSQYRTIPGTSGGGVSALAVNTAAPFQGHIAFVRNHQLYILSGKDDKVSAVPAGNNVQDPAYSPDGSRLAYVRRGANWSDVMVIPAKGGTPVVLTHNQGADQNILCANGASEEDSAWAANPIWAPDGSALYYLSDAQKLDKTSCGFLDMAIWNVATQKGTPQLVLWPARGTDTTGLPGAGGDANLSLRPGANNELTYTHYAYDPTQNGSVLVQIFLAPLNQTSEAGPGTQQELALTPAKNGLQALEGAWSPDGQFLAYIQANTTPGTNSTSLAVMRVGDPARGAPGFEDAATSKALAVGGTTLDPVSYPAWAPDGKSLLYLQFKNNEYNLYLSHVIVNGTTISLQGDPIQLTQGGIDGDSRPSWTGS
jgi:Tol biopolymer transport system component